VPIARESIAILRAHIDTIGIVPDGWIFSSG